MPDSGEQENGFSGCGSAGHRFLYFLAYPFVLAFFIPSTTTAFAQAGRPDVATSHEALPDNRAELQLSLPPGATIQVDGVDYGEKRLLTFEPLVPGKTFQYALTVRFRNGGAARRTLLMRGSRRVSLTLLEPDSSRPELVLQSGHYVRSIAFSPDGGRIMTGSDDGTAILWDLATRRQLRHFNAYREDSSSVARSDFRPVKKVAFSADGNRALTVNNVATLWDVATGRRNRMFEVFVLGVKCADFRPDGREIVINGSEYEGEGETFKTFSTVDIIDTATGRKKRSIRIEKGILFPDYVAISPDGSRVITEGKNNSIDVWDAATGARRRTLIGHSNKVAKAVFSGDGRHLLTSSSDLAIWWDVSAGIEKRRFKTSGSAIAIHPDGGSVATSVDDGSVARWSVETGDRLQTYAGERKDVSEICFSPDGSHIVTADGDANVWVTATGEKLVVLGGAGPQRVLSARLSSDASRIAYIAEEKSGRFRTISGKGKSVVLWNTTDQVPPLILKSEQRSLRALALSPVNDVVLAAADDKSVCVWDLATGAPQPDLRGPSDFEVELAEFSPDGERILLAGRDYSMPARFSLLSRNGRPLRSFQAQSADVISLEFNKDGSRVLTALKGELDFEGLRAGRLGLKSPPEICVWDLSSGRKLKSHTIASSELSTDVAGALSPDGKSVVTAFGKQLERWNPDTGQTLAFVSGHRGGTGVAGGVESVAFSSDDRSVITGGGSASGKDSPGSAELYIWSAASGTRLRTLTGHSQTVSSIAAYGNTVLSSSWDKTAILWNASNGQMQRQLTGSDWIVLAAAISPDGKRALTGSGRYKKSGQAILWDVATGRQMQVLRGHQNYVGCVAFHPLDNNILATGSFDGTVIFWDARTGTQMRTFEPHKGTLGGVRFSGDGRKLLTVGYEDLMVCLWDVASLKPIWRTEGHTKAITTAALSRDGQYAVTGSIDQTVVIWDAASGTRLQTCFGHSQGVTAVAFNSDDTRFVSGGIDGRAIIWDAITGAEIERLQGHDLSVTAMAYSHDGRLALSAAEDGTAILWDTQLGSNLRAFRGHTMDVRTVAFTVDDEKAVTSSADGSVRVWDVHTGEELVRLMVFDDGNDWLAVTREGFFDGSTGARARVMFRIGGGLNVVPVDRFFQDFYRPGLLAAVWRGENLGSHMSIGQSLPPVLKIRSHASGKVETSHVDIDVEAIDLGGGVTKLAIFQNGARVLAPGETRQDGKTIRRTFRVALVEGPNHFRVTAASGDGSWESEPAEVTLNFERPLGRSRLHVLTVGISKYGDGNLDLGFAAKDAQTLGQLFDRRGGRLYEGVHVTNLLDDAAKKTEIVAAIKKVAAATRPQDTLLVFMAGHGSMVGQRYYYLPYGFHKESDRLEDDIRQQGLPADDISDQISSAQALKRVLILDTCASGGALSSVVRGRSGVALRGAVERLSRSSGVFTIAAASASEEAQESKELGHGVLTYALLAGLKGVSGGPLETMAIQPNNPERVADALEWFAFAAGHVPRLTEKLYGARQEVQTSTQGQSFPVLPLDD